MDQGELLEGGLRVAGAAGVGELGGKLAAFGEGDRDDVGVELAEGFGCDLELHGGRVYSGRFGAPREDP